MEKYQHKLYKIDHRRTASVGAFAAGLGLFQGMPESELSLALE